MAELVGFSPDDVKRLYSLLQRVRDQEFNYRTRPAFDVDTVYNDPSSAPEVYVVKTPPEGIGYAQTAYADTGTGTDQVLIPGYAQCQFLTFKERYPEDGQLHAIDSLTNTVYNLGSDEIDGDSYVLAVRIKSGQYIAIRLYPPDTGTDTGLDTDCHLRIDNSNKIFLNVPTLAGPGLETTSTGTGTGTCWTLGINTGCTTYIDDDNKLQVDVKAIAGDGLEATTGTGTDCKYLNLKYGCHFYIDANGRLQLNISALVGRGLSTGTGTCINLNVDDDTGTADIGCGLYLDQQGKLAVNLNQIVGAYLSVNESGSCPVVDVVIPLGCGLAYDILSGAIYVDFDEVVGTALSWAGCRLNILFDCHLTVDGSGNLGVDVESLAGDNTETGLKKYDANPCSPLSNDYVVAREDEKFYVADDRILMVGTVLTQFQILRLEKRTFNAANELIGWEDLGETLLTREIVDLCGDICDTGTGTGTSTGTTAEPGYHCFYYEVTHFPFDSVVYGPLCAQLTDEQVTALENDGAVFFGGPFDTYEECDEFCPDTGTADPGCGTQADCGTELFVGVSQNGSTTADLCTAYSIVIPLDGTYKITATHTSGSSDVELRWLSACDAGLTLGVVDFSGTIGCINLGAQTACTVLYFCVTRTGGAGSQGFSLIVGTGTC